MSLLIYYMGFELSTLAFEADFFSSSSILFMSISPSSIRAYFALGIFLFYIIFSSSMKSSERCAPYLGTFGMLVLGIFTSSISSYALGVLAD